MPEGVINEGRILDPDTFIDILKSLRQEYKISARDAVLVLNDELALVLHTNMPAENPEELQLALPAEFSDFITQNPESYVYDYVIEEEIKNKQGKAESFEIFASAARINIIESYMDVLNKAGFKLRYVFPEADVYASLLRENNDEDTIVIPRAGEDTQKHVLIVDLGYKNSLAILYKNGYYQASKTIDLGVYDLDLAIADACGSTFELIEMYKYNNYENILDHPDCISVYNRIIMEFEKVINFYKFSTGFNVDCIYLTGGGANITRLVSAIGDAFPQPVHTLNYALPHDVALAHNEATTLLAIASLLESKGE